MNHYAPPANSAAFLRGAPPPFRGPPQAFPRPGLPLFRPPFTTRGPPPPFAFARGPLPAFHGRVIPPGRCGPPSGIARLSIPRPMMATLGFQAPGLRPVRKEVRTLGLVPPGWTEHKTSQGVTYYHNPGTGVSTYEMPRIIKETEKRARKWMEYKDEATGAFYYFNTVTNETVWDQPEEFRMERAREQVARMKTEAAMQTAVSSPIRRPAVTLTVAPATQASASAALQQIPAPDQISVVSLESKVEVDEEKLAEQRRREVQEKLRQERKEALEREQAAEFENMSCADRMTAFKQFLEDKQIAPTLKWGDAQRVIGKDSSLSSDPRWKFALTSVGEKKQAFAEYCTHAKNRATIEKRRLVKKTREEFTELLGLFESILAPPSRRRQVSWDEVVENSNFYALRQDARWSAVVEIRERQQLFATFMQELERNQKARLAKQRDEIQTAFVELLRQRVKSNQLDLGTNHSSKRLEADVKRCVLDLLEEVELPNNGGKVGKDALRVVDRHDVYSWAEKLLEEHRELERAKRKRERAERVERQEKMMSTLDERLKELIAAQKLTAGSLWEAFSAEHLKDASEQQARELKSDTEGAVAANAVCKDREDGDGEHLHWKAQRQAFEKYVRRLRRDLEPVALAIRAYLDRDSDPPLRITETTSYAVYVDALESVVGVALDKNAPEEGEEEVSEETNDVTKGAVEDPDVSIAKGSADKLKKLKSEEINAALEAAVKKQREMKTSRAGVEFPAYVRHVYDMWVAIAREESRKEQEKKPKHLKRSRKESHDLTVEADGGESRPRRSRRRSSVADGVEHGKNNKKQQSHRAARKRRRSSHGSLSKSRSRSAPRCDGSSNRRSRPNCSRSRNRSRSRDRDRALPPSSAARSSKPRTTKDTYSPLRTPSKPLSAAEEAAKAEEIIRQARLKLQAKNSMGTSEELEEGEEVEEGEENEN